MVDINSVDDLLRIPHHVDYGVLFWEFLGNSAEDLGMDNVHTWLWLITKIWCKFIFHLVQWYFSGHGMDILVNLSIILSQYT